MYLTLFVVLSFLFVILAVNASAFRSSSEQADLHRLRTYIQEMGHELIDGFGENEREARIIGGSISPRALPFLAAIRLKTANNYHYCAGALVDRMHVVTAAHCILPQMQRFPNVLQIRMNVTNIHDDENAVDIDVARVERNPNFNGENFYHDVAIVTLRSPAPAQVGARGESTAIRLAEPGSNYAGRFAAVAGWGVTQAPVAGQSARGAPNARRLHYLIEQVQPQRECKRVYRGIVNPEFCDCQLCAGGKAQQDACQGDSGAPMWVIESDGKPTFMGIVSTGTSCGMEGRPGIYSAVAPHLDYIQSHMGDGGFGGGGGGSFRGRADSEDGSDE